MNNEKKIDKGSVFILVFIVCAVTLGYLMIGGTIPTRLPGYNNNLVTIISPAADIAHNTLQLRTFSGVTITPYPTLAGGQDTGAKSLQYSDCGHTLSGKTEPDILYAFQIGSSAASTNLPAVKVFYDDEHALTLGAGTVSPMTKQPADHVSKPNVGNIASKDPDKLPFAPSIFLTDITTNANSTTGDGENGGIPLPPSDVYGSWKAVGGTDPIQPNPTDLAGGDPWPASNGPSTNEGHDITYISEIIWKIPDLRYSGLPLIAGHTYRAEFVIHDGDSSGDIGEACVNIQA